jgi:protein-disulfide isomerase
MAGLIIAGAIIFTNGGKNISEKTTPSQVKNSPPQVKVKPKTAGDPYLGNPLAKVKIVVYEDFQCPFCKHFEEDVFPILKEKYLDTGKAVLYFKNFAFLGKDSTTVAIAGECIIKQSAGNFGPYWDWHRAMFEKQDAENTGFGSVKDIKQLIRELNLEKGGLNLTQFDKCLDDQETIKEVQSDIAEGRKNGVKGTPATLINGQLISGAQPVSVFTDVVEAELK